MFPHQKVFVLRSRDQLGGVISNNAQPLFVCFVGNSSSTGGLDLTLNLNVTPAYPYQMTQTKYTCRENESESLFSTCNIPHVAQPSQLFAQISQYAYQCKLFAVRPMARKYIFFCHPVDTFPEPWGNCFVCMCCWVRPIPRRSIFVCLFASEDYRLNGTG